MPKVPQAEAYYLRTISRQSVTAYIERPRSPEFGRLASFLFEASADREQNRCGTPCLPRMMSNIPGFLGDSIK